MKIIAGQIRLTASDLSNHLACRHLTVLDLEVAKGKRSEPDWAAPDLHHIRELGLRHERNYLEHLFLKTRLPKMRIGTVDKFQGQEAPVVIYSLTSPSPEEAPRGMEFLYSLNRLNVATSRAKTAVIVVGNPKLFEPEWTPRQIQLANAFCGYLEMAIVVDPDAIW